MTKDEALLWALEALEGADQIDVDMQEAIAAIKEALAQEQEPVLQDIEQYRMQIAGICTAAIGYWKEGDSIYPDYDTLALRDVAKLYAKYDALYKSAQRQPEQKPVAWIFQHEETGQTMCVDAQQVEWGFEKGNPRLKKIDPLYTSPPQREWVGLTDEEKQTAVWTDGSCGSGALWAEANLKDKNI